MAAKGDVLGSISPLPSKISQQGDFCIGQRELTLDAISSDIWKTGHKVPTEQLHWFSVWFGICQSSYQLLLRYMDKQKKFWFTSNSCRQYRYSQPQQDIPSWLPSCYFYPQSAPDSWQILTHYREFCVIFFLQIWKLKEKSELCRVFTDLIKAIFTLSWPGL